MKLKKVLLTFCFVLIFASTFALTASAATTEINNETSVSIQISNEDISVYSDVIETKFCFDANGRVMYRRWNATKGYWVDPDWIYA